MEDNVYAVITGDIVNSSKLSPIESEKLINDILVFGKKISTIESFNYILIDIFRGDSFQIIVKKPEKALYIAMLFRLYVRYRSNKVIGKMYDARIAIGIGHIESFNENMDVRMMTGEAFVKSGHLIDELKKQNTIRCSSIWDKYTNSVLDACSISIDIIIKSMTSRQLDVFFNRLIHPTQLETSKRLKIAPQRTSQYLKHAYYKQAIDLTDLFGCTVTRKIKSSNEQPCKS